MKTLWRNSLSHYSLKQAFLGLFRLRSGRLILFWSMHSVVVWEVCHFVTLPFDCSMLWTKAGPVVLFAHWYSRRWSQGQNCPWPRNFWRPKKFVRSSSNQIVRVFMTCLIALEASSFFFKNVLASFQIIHSTFDPRDEITLPKFYRMCCFDIYHRWVLFCIVKHLYEQLIN